MTFNSDSSTLKKDQKQNESEVSSKPNSDFPNGFRITDSIEPELDREEVEEAESTDSSGSSNLKNQSIFWAIEVSENEDGFKTPTSLEHKIPPVTECPPAPKKPRESRKRKASPPPRVRRGLRIDCSEEIESMFPPPIQEGQGREIKRSRSGKSE